MEFGNWTLDPDKFLSREDAIRLLAAAADDAKYADLSQVQIAVRNHFIIDLGLATGLRVMEISQLKCGDVFLKDGVSSVLVRKGKGGKRRLVFVNGVFKKHCRKYLKWMQSVGQSIEQDSPLFPSSKTGKHMTTRAIQKIFKQCAAKAGLPSFYSIHTTRHTYACQLLKASNWNLRLVQKQLGHSRISTTQVYADVMMPDIEKALDRLYQ